METKEKNFEQDIESWLLTEGGYVKGNMWTYDKKRAIDMPVLIQFIEATQPKQWERYQNIYGEAKKWLSKSAAQGNKDAKVALKKFFGK